MKFPFRIGRRAFQGGTGPCHEFQRDIEGGIALGPDRENRVARLQNALLGDFAEAVVFLGESDDLIERERFGGRRRSFLGDSGAAGAENNTAKNKAAQA